MNRKELVDQYFNPDNKLNQKQFAMQHGIPQQTFFYWLNKDPRFRFTRSKAEYTKQQKEQLLEQYFNPDNKLNQSKFAMQHGIPQATFFSWLNKDPRFTRSKAEYTKQAYPEQQKEQFLEQYFNPDNKLNQSKFAMQHGIPKQTFVNWLNKDPRFTRSKAEYTKQQKEQFLEQYFNPDNKLNKAQFAKQHGIPRATFNTCLVKDSKNKNTNEPQPGTSRDSTGAFPNQIHEAPTLFHTPTFDDVMEAEKAPLINYSEMVPGESPMSEETSTPEISIYTPIFDDVVKAMEEPMINFSQTISKEEKSPSKMKVKISYATEKSKQSNLSKQASTSRDHPYR